MNSKSCGVEKAVAVGASRQPWVDPQIEVLPRLTDLTLQTANLHGDGIEGYGTAGEGASLIFR